jgi:hypothetical protein
MVRFPFKLTTYFPGLLLSIRRRTLTPGTWSAESIT